jgi:hypothetical protein
MHEFRNSSYSDFKDPEKQFVPEIVDISKGKG